MPEVEILEDGGGLSVVDTPRGPLPRGGRRLVAGLAGLLLLGGGVLFVRDWTAEREARQAVDVSVTFGVVSSSTVPPGGSVRYFALIRNDGALPIAVTSVTAAETGLRLNMRDDGARTIAPGEEIEVPLSVRLTCIPGAGESRPAQVAEIGVLREDGGATSERAELPPADLLRDAAASLCLVRPELRDHELSGPVLRSGG